MIGKNPNTTLILCVSISFIMLDLSLLISGLVRESVGLGNDGHNVHLSVQPPHELHVHLPQPGSSEWSEWLSS